MRGLGESFRPPVPNRQPIPRPLEPSGKPCSQFSPGLGPHILQRRPNLGDIAYGSSASGHLSDTCRSPDPALVREPPQGETHGARAEKHGVMGNPESLTRANAYI